MSAERAHLRLVPDPDADPEAETNPTQEERAPEAPVDLTSRAGFEAVYERWSPYVARIGLKILGEHELARELVQEVFTRALEHRDRIEDPSQLKAWLRTTATRLCYRMLRKRKVLVLIGYWPEPKFEELVLPETSTEHEVLVRELFAKLERVPAKQRVAWALRYLEGDKLTDVAEACGCSLATVKRRIKRANDLLVEEA